MSRPVQNQASPSPEHRATPFASRIRRMLACTAGLALVFALHARSEQLVIRAHEHRYRSYLLADEMRQSEDDLTRMVRAYVATGDPVYKRRFQDIQDIRDGKKRRPEGYSRPYWSLWLPGGAAPRAESPLRIPLLDLMRQAGFSSQEFDKLAEAERNSDALTTREFEAMKLIESNSPASEARRLQAVRMLHDATYLGARASVMTVIDDFLVRLDERTLRDVRSAEAGAAVFRWLFAGLGLTLMFMLWRTYGAVSLILGGSMDEVQARIRELGGGEFSAAVQADAGVQESVMGWLSQTQTRLAEMDRERTRAEEVSRAASIQNARLFQEAQRTNAALTASEARFRRVVESNMVGVVFWDRSGAIIEANQAVLTLLGYALEDIRSGEVDWRRLTPSEYRDLDEKALREIEETGVCAPFERECIKKDGTRVAVLIGGASFPHEPGRGVAFVLDISERRRAEAEVRKLSRVVEQAALSIVVTDLEGAIEYVNPAFCELTGYGPEEVQGRNPRILKSGDTPTAVYRDLWATLTVGQVWRGEFVNRKKSGEAYVERAVIAPVSDSGGRISYYVGLKEDISREKELEREARESGERFEQLARHINEVFWMTDVRKREMLYVSPAYEAIWGRTCASLLASPQAWLDAVHPDDREQTGRAALTEQAKGAYDIEYRIVRPDGATRWIHDRAFPVENEAGEVYRIVGVATDITERRQAEEALIASEQRLRQIMDFTPGIVWEADASTFNFTSVSMNAERLLGYPTTEWLTPGFWEGHLHPDDRERTVRSCQIATSTSEDHELEYRFLGRDGQVLWLRDIVRVIRENGRPRWLRGLMVDITSARQAREALQSSLNEKEALLKEVHHRVKNNLQVIASLLRLETARNGDASTIAVLRDMQDRVQSMALLHETLYRAGTFASVDLASYLGRLAAQSFRALDTRRGAIALELELASVQVELDQAVPCGLLVNELISNCLKHAFPGQTSGRIRIAVQAINGATVRLSVADTGVGLPADFESRRSRSLGLQLASDLAKQLGGRLEINSEPSSGASFAVAWAGRGEAGLRSAPA